MKQLLSKRDAEVAASPPAMSEYVIDWWNSAITDFQDEVSSTGFIEKVIKWFNTVG